ncbi:type IV toxin-antitoxin system AbiEi family antitoxin domain-containing protein [Marinoscillum pacificum]|uniref:type IV toxin-antitoxin system AbiEi family antitoxin domain-containing protein n=1 Tax=Marinoscillum pacificum TaxID=392723 RepID=UPI0021586E21|nr:type IV toxin-antitoxin system AbiEi family antitoxin [Marinoscillum pacificum]
MRAREYIKHLLSIESYSFSLAEISNQTDTTDTSLKFELARLVEKREIINFRKGFYLIIPPRYSKQGFLPIQLYIQKLFQSLNRNYYLGFYSAARFYGASHQQTHREYVMIEKPKLNEIKKNDFDIEFITASQWPVKNIIEKKSDAGYFYISSPVLTAADLIHHQTKLGGINRMLAILEELSEEITNEDLNDLLTWYPHRSTIQRLAFILDELQADIDLSVIFNYLKSAPYFPVLLSPKKNQKAGSVDNRWKVDVNIKLESDL